MDEVAALAVAGEAEGTVVVADEQTAGRGRAGRSWQAPAGTALLCSVLLRPSVAPARLSTLPLVAGVAVADAIEAASGVVCRLKWPNDVWIGERKVAGVLLAARSGGSGVEHAVVGTGINVNTSPVDLPPGATSLLAATQCAHDREALFGLLLARLDGRYRAWLAADGRPDLTDWHERALYLGEPVVIRVGTEEHVGTMRGVDGDGALLLEGTDGQLTRIVAGDLTRGPVRPNLNAIRMTE
jgi:BirA family biotin operon repressor/biotin-[acetyl-CoA-carboxylase] ligase